MESDQRANLNDFIPENLVSVLNISLDVEKTLIPFP
jgi:hypothetical protein